MLCIARQIEARVTFTLHNKTYSYPTVDYFQRPTNNFTRVGLLMVPPLLPNCKFPLPPPMNESFKASVRADPGRIIMCIRWKYMLDSGCVSYGQVMDQFSAFNDAFVAAGFPNSDTVLIWGAEDGPDWGMGFPYGPNFYQSHTWSGSEDLPTVDTMMLSNTNGLAMFDVIGMNFVNVTAVREEGSWNPIFLSWYWFLLSDLLACMNWGIFLYGMWQVLLSLKTFRRIPMQLRSFIFCLGLITCVTAGTYPFLRVFTHPRLMLEILTEGIQSILRVLYFLLWQRVLSERVYVNGRRDKLQLLPLYAVICIGLIAALWELIYLPFGQFMPYDPLITKLNLATIIAIPVVKYFLGFVFLYYAYRFWKRRQQWLTSEDASRALRKFTLICIAGMVIFFCSHTVAITIALGNNMMYNYVAGLKAFRYLWILFWETMDNAVAIIWLGLKTTTLKQDKKARRVTRFSAVLNGRDERRKAAVLPGMDLPMDFTSVDENVVHLHSVDETPSIDSSDVYATSTGLGSKTMSHIIGLYQQDVHEDDEKSLQDVDSDASESL